MDWINKITIGAITVLSLMVTAMLVQHEIELKRLGLNVDRKADFIKQYKLKIAKNAKIYKDVVVNLDKKNYTEAMAVLDKIIEEHPDNPQSLIYRAQIERGFGKLAEPIHTYRLAINAEPGYIDKKTPLFMGKTIMALIKEARVKLNREIKLKPNDRTIRLALEDIYYLQRRIAGGCE